MIRLLHYDKYALIRAQNQCFWPYVIVVFPAQQIACTMSYENNSGVIGRMTTNRFDTQPSADGNGSDNVNAFVATNLGWLADAPLFIDGDRIDSFYNAVVRPTHQQEGATLRVEDDTSERIKTNFGVTGKLSLGALGQLFAGLLPTAEAGAEAKREAETIDSKKKFEEIILRPINTPQSQLVQLTLHYLINQPERLFIVDDLSEPSKRSSSSSKGFWRDPQTISKVPRELVFLNLPSREEARKHEEVLPTKLIPITVEFDNGEVEFLYEWLKGDEEWPPNYPEDITEEKELGELVAERKEYWQKFEKNFSPRRSMAAIEQAAKNRGRIRWITYRVPLTKEGDTIHLSLSPAQKYDTGTFVYTLIRHGYEHGLRLVGTLRSEPTMNVLAIFEK